MTPNDVITEVRQLIQDTTTPYRYSDAILLGFVNQTIKRVALFRPDLFSTVGALSTTADQVHQNLPSTALRLIDIYQVSDGNAIEEVDRDLFARTYPAWTSAPSGTPVKYMRHSRNPTEYFLYPKPTNGITLIGEYAESPSTYAGDDSIDNLSDAYLPVVVDGVVYLAESVDNEYVSTDRAKFFLKSFQEGLGLSAQARALTDMENPTFSTGGQR